MLKLLYDNPATFQHHNSSRYLRINKRWRGLLNNLPPLQNARHRKFYKVEIIYSKRKKVATRMATFLFEINYFFLRYIANPRAIAPKIVAHSAGSGIAVEITN